MPVPCIYTEEQARVDNHVIGTSRGLNSPVKLITMGKRPLGLAKAAKFKEKKQKTTDETPASENPSLDKENALNIAVDETTDDNDLAEIYGLYNEFEKSSKANPKMALGLVHECDSLLRERKKLPAKFHFVYGSALLTISSFQDDDAGEGESPGDFIEAAIDRLDVGLSEDENYTPLKVMKAVAKVLKVGELLRKVQDPEAKARVVEKNLKDLQSSKALLDEVRKCNTNDSLTQVKMAEAILTLQLFAVSLEVLPLKKGAANFVDEISNWTSKVWKDLVAGENPSVQNVAYQGLGETHLSKANGVLQRLEAEVDEEDEGSDDSDSDDPIIFTKDAEFVRKELNSAIENLQKVAKDDAPTIYAQIAEAKISIGNLTKNKSSEQDKLYADAVKLLKKAQRLGAGDYHELIDSLEEE